MHPIEHNETFDLAYRFVTETSENIFLTGKAGTGKTTFLRYLKEKVAKNIIVAAPTGVAAINAGGVTLHSLFQLPFHPFLPTKNSKEDLLLKTRINKQRLQLLRKMELLVIDEISMVRCDTMDAIDTILKSVRRNYHLPFGGVQLLCIGDLHQLEPVTPKRDWAILSEYYSSPFFFDSHAIKEQTPLLIELTKIYRQKEESFVRLLNKVRNNQMNSDDFEDLHLRYNPSFYPPSEEKYITLTTHNTQADLINQQQLQRLSGRPFTYIAIIEQDFPENMYPAEKELVLREGAQVMFLKNDVVQKRYYNGKIGVVKSLEEEKIIVECDEIDIEVRMESWENTRYLLNRADGKLEQETLGTFTQYPLQLAWAITIHKSQGLTFDRVMIDAGAAFSSGQVYVALSRCTSLEGIVLLSKITPTAITSNENIIKGQQTLSHKGSLEIRFAGARQAFTLQLLEELFSFEEIEFSLLQLELQIKQHENRLNPGALDWVEILKKQLLSERSVGLKFGGLVSQLIKEEGVVERNELLQQRIMDAANHFIPKLNIYLKSILDHPLITEHKEAAMPINECLLGVAISVYNSCYYLQNCQQPFSVTGFLQHKLNYVLPHYPITCYASGKKATTALNTDIPNIELFDALKRWRDMVCTEESLPIYMVANQASLKEICTYLPLVKKDLLQISGFGKAKVDKYGDDILAAVESYCDRFHLESQMKEMANNSKNIRKEKISVKKIDTKIISFNLYKEGKTVLEIAKERNFNTATIEGHLAHFIGSGEIDINNFVSKQKQEQIKQAVAIHGTVSHKTLLENLPTGISYGEVKMVLALDKK